MSRKTLTSNVVSKPIVISLDPTECPFREYRDNELQPEFWGMGPAAFRAHSLMAKGGGAPKTAHDSIWVDDQTQPLPRSVRQYLHGYVRAEELAMSRWEAEVVIFDENDGGRMSVADMQLSHAQVLLRSSFCRQVLSACFMLERSENVMIEHQWENFSCSFGAEGWRAKYHIYSPGSKPGGGPQHRPTLSKNGCYLVRLFHLGAWRCVWVSDQVPVDATDSPLLPFSPLLSNAPPMKGGAKNAPAMVTANVVYLWPLLICKALLKLAAPDMNSDEDTECMDDELMPELDILHALTGAINMNFRCQDAEELWNLLASEVAVFSWDDDDETQASTVKSKSAKKPTTKEAVARGGMMYIIIHDTKDYPPYHLPGITPGFEMSLLVTMARDLPIKKPLPEPEVAFWKYYRWVDWARSHGLYELYDCPRTRFLKVNGLMKLSFAPHLLDIQSTESITIGFVKADLEKTNPALKDKNKNKESKTGNQAANQAMMQVKEELREWIQYDSIYELVKTSYVLYYPSMYEFTSAASSPPVRVTKVPWPKHLDVLAPKTSPLYLQIDGPEVNTIRISLSMLHPRLLSNSGVLIEEYVESAYMVLECFEWFIDCEVPKPKAFVRTCGYDAVQVSFQPGRHFCRLWVYSRMNWHLMLLSESTLLLGPRDQIQCAAVRECHWAYRFLMALGSAFSNWLRVNRSNHFLPSVQLADKEFFKAYHPDLPWDNKVVGYDRAFLHWMFRQALQVHLLKRLMPADMRQTFVVLRKYFCDPDLGLPVKSPPPISVRMIHETDPCDCVMPEIEEVEMIEEQIEELEEQAVAHEEICLVSPDIMEKLLTLPKPPIASNVCELATEEVPCGLLKEERSKMVRKHEAATTIQSYWRGFWARQCLNSHVVVTAEVMRALSDTTFGNQEALSCLMKEFFILYPGAKYAYSVASALSGVYGLNQHTGTTLVYARCKWIPYFQGVFYCHAPVKVHFDVNSTLHHSTIAVYDNDTGMQLPQAYNAHKTFEFSPNSHGYTVMGHGSLNEASGIQFDVNWQLTVLSSTDGAFHVCDNDEICKELHLPPAHKLHIDEIFLPNRRNILGGIQLSVTKHEAVSFRACATSPDLAIVANLRTVLPNGTVEELSSCSGTGEIFWPYIRLEPTPPKDMSHAAFGSQSTPFPNISMRSLTKAKAKAPDKKQKSNTKLKSTIHVPEPKHYFIEVVAPLGWPLTIAQWRRVDEVRNSRDVAKAEPSPKKTILKDKPGSGRDRRTSPVIETPLPQVDDAFVELECSLAIGGGIQAKRDDERDVEFANARRAWDEKEPGRNKRGAELRKEFRSEYLEVPPPPPLESANSTTPDFFMLEHMEEEHLEEDTKKMEQIPGPTPATESALIEMSLESEEEALYLTMPEQLRDNFIPLYFVPLCMKELSEDGSVLLTPDMAEAAKQDRHARIDAALERMRELQEYNEIYVLGRQRERCILLDKLFVDAQWPPDLQQVLIERDEAIEYETLQRTLSANKKKQDSKKK
ncbi:uncharacterized protein LOC142974618 isoform X2 [Anticarsia gemmatalis]|uniref:uncharacterized protein LOC142974618 isoform X2 n=1 Tax=Anticarsia gemmatalis TaxID=129554 RepID=UPI003F75DE28